MKVRTLLKEPVCLKSRALNEVVCEGRVGFVDSQARSSGEHSRLVEWMQQASQLVGLGLGLGFRVRIKVRVTRWTLFTGR